MIVPTYQRGPVTLYRGDMIEVLPYLETASVDGLITDPPYSSGGFTRSDRSEDPSKKYVQNGTHIVRGTFSGDNRDGRSWRYWIALWLSETTRVVRPGGYCLLFTDWRQLPLCTDAIQAGGFVWRGIVAWDKGRGARAPHKGYFRHQCEYVVWGSNGPLAIATHDGPYDGCVSIPVVQSDKHHMTGKPTELMSQLVRTIPPGGTVLDPFMGSGTTGVSCVRMRRKFIGIEKDSAYFDVAVKRIEAAFQDDAMLGGSA
jgi:site-specific DNA-methyltransferase (adenine-specific)